MKTKKIAILGITAVLLFSGTLIGVYAGVPNISLPGEPVTMTVSDGSVSYFDIYLTNVPEGFDVTNGYYVGWCADRSVKMPRDEQLVVRLWNSYDPMLPYPLREKNWSKVNYILNHKDDATKIEIQGAIWFLLNDYPAEISLLSTKAQDLVNSADGLFVPKAGEWIAILAEPLQMKAYPWPFQFAFLQVRLPHHGCEGLTPGYWQNIRKHLGDWIAPYTPDTPLGDVFENTSLYDLEDDTMIDALSPSYGGGPEVIDMARTLLRAATAAVLNAAHPNIDYPISEEDIIGEVNDALSSFDRDTMEDLKDILDANNNLGADLSE